MTVNRAHLRSACADQPLPPDYIRYGIYLYGARSWCIECISNSSKAPFGVSVPLDNRPDVHVGLLACHSGGRLEDARSGPLTTIPKQGTVSAINVLTGGGWVRFTGDSR